MSTREFKIFPAERMAIDYPWIIWAVGWLALLKAFLWLAYEPAESESILRLMAYKHIINILPMVVCGVGIWNLRKWAAWGLMAASIGNLIFFFVNQQTLNAVMVHSEVRLYTMILSGITLLCNGPIGDLLIICAAPGMLKHAKN